MGQTASLCGKEEIPSVRTQGDKEERGEDADKRIRQGEEQQRQFSRDQQHVDMENNNADIFCTPKTVEDLLQELRCKDEEIRYA